MVELTKDNDDDRPPLMIGFDGKLYFRGKEYVYGVEMWVYDPLEPDAGARLVGDIMPGAASSSPYDFTVMDDKLYFYGQYPDIGAELLVYDPSCSASIR